MPVDVAFLDGGVGALRSCSGDFTAQQLINANNQLLAAREQLAACRYVLADFTLVTSFKISASDVRQLVDMDIRIAAIKPRLVVAIVAPTDLTYGMSRMWEIMAEKTGWETMVFRTRAQAEDWVRQKVSE